VLPAARDDRRDHFVGEDLPGLGVAEEARHADEEILAERLHLLLVPAQKAYVLGAAREITDNDFYDASDPSG